MVNKVNEVKDKVKEKVKEVTDKVADFVVENGKKILSKAMDNKLMNIILTFWSKIMREVLSKLIIPRDRHIDTRPFPKLTQD